MAKISVIIPAYNCAGLISRTIQSVRNQTFQDWELIVVDDGSTDNTRDVVLSFQKNDPRIKYLNQPNSGAPASPKNNGIRNATGDYIAFLDHDDEWLPEKLEKHVSVFEKFPKTGLVASNAMIVNEANGQKKEYKMPQNSDIICSLLERNVVFCSSGATVKKDVFDQAGLFDENFKLGDDWDMWIRIAKKFNFRFINEPLYNFYRHDKTVTSRIKMATKIKDYEYGLAKHIDLYKQHPKQFSSRLLNIGRTCYMAGENKKAITFFARSILANPLKGKAYVNLFFGLLGPRCYNLFLNLRDMSKKNLSNA